MNPTAKSISQAIRDSKRVLVCTHFNPDGDALGSIIAMDAGLEALGIESYAYCRPPWLAHFFDLPGIDRVHKRPPSAGKKFDLTIVLDCGSADRVGDEIVFQGKIVNIDHHGSNGGFGDLCWIDTDAAAAGELVFQLLEALEVEPTQTIAKALYLALMTDTGSFRYSNTTPETFRIARELIKRGADPTEAARLYYENASPQSLQLQGLALARMEIVAKGRVAWSQLTAEDYEAHGGMANEPEGLSALLRGVRGVEAGCLFTEVKNQGVRISLRSHGKVDVSLVARQFGGGGHPAAAGAFIKKRPLDEVRNEVLEVIESLF